MDKNYGQKLWTKIIFVPFLIANNFTYLRCEEVCCDCCKECLGKLGFFSNDYNYKTYNEWYDNIINMINNCQFDDIRKLYKEKISEIRKKISEAKIEFNNKNINNEKIECNICKNEAEKYDVINGSKHCETCFPEAIAQNKEALNKDIPYCIPRFNLLLTKNKYLVLKVDILAIFVDKDNNLFIRGDWDDKLTYTEECYDNNNELFQKIGEGVFVYNYRKAERIKSNKACAYFVIGSKIDKGFNFYNPTFNFSTLIGLHSFTQRNTINLTKENSPDFYTYFAICFYLVFQLIYYSKYFEINNEKCTNGCSKICVSQLHYFYDYSKKNNSCIEKLLVDDFNNVKIIDNKEIMDLESFLKGLYSRATEIPEYFTLDFTYPKKILESIKTGFEKNEYIAQ